MTLMILVILGLTNQMRSMTVLLLRAAIAVILVHIELVVALIRDPGTISGQSQTDGPVSESLA